MTMRTMRSLKLNDDLDNEDKMLSLILMVIMTMRIVRSLKLNDDIYSDDDAVLKLNNFHYTP